MEKSKQAGVNQVLLIPQADLLQASGYTIQMCGTLSELGKDPIVHTEVFLVNCKKAEEIPALIKEGKEQLSLTLETELNEKEPSEEFVEFLETYLEKLSNIIKMLERTPQQEEPNFSAKRSLFIQGTELGDNSILLLNEV